MNRPMTRRLAWLTLCAAIIALAPALSWAQTFDDLNGLWRVTLDGQSLSETALTESYPAVGVRMRFQGKVHSLTRSGDTLILGDVETIGIVGALEGTEAAPDDLPVKLLIGGLDTKFQGDDTLTGTFFGQQAVFKRDMRSKRPIDIRLPGDRPWVRFMHEILIPKTAEDRESYHFFYTPTARKFLQDCQLYRSGYWLYSYMKGATRWEQKASFENIVRGMWGAYVSPRRILNTKFTSLVLQNLSPKGQAVAGLAMSSLGMYFSTAAGGSVRIHVTDNDDSIIYYITDRRSNARLGLVVMKTPAHAPLASTFGKWHLDFSALPTTDDDAMTRAILETMTKSSSQAANALSPIGRSAYTDYLGVMAIEDQRGAMFDNDGLGWGYNMTNACFATLIARALAHGEYRTGPEQLGSKQELAMQVIVSDGWSGTSGKLQPGDASYWDVLNGADNVLEGGKGGGYDMQEYGGMATLKKLTSDWLKARHTALVTRVEKSLAGIRPAAELSYRARADIFHFMCENFYDKRSAAITPAQATEIVDAGLALTKAVREHSHDLEAYILANGIEKSPEWAPRASGY